MAFKWQINKLAESNICFASKSIDFDSDSAARREHLEQRSSFGANFSTCEISRYAYQYLPL